MDLLPKPNRVRLAVQDGALTRAECTKLEHVIVVLPQRITTATLKDFDHAATIKALRNRARDKNSVLGGTLPGKDGTGISLATVSNEASTFDRLSLGRRLLDDALRANPSSIGVVSLESDAGDRSATVQAVAAAALVRGVRLPSFKSKPDRPSRLRRVALFGGPEVDVRRLTAESDANSLARHLSALPPNVLTAKALAEVAEELATSEGWQYEFYDELMLGELGAGAFLAVARGNDHSNAGIVHLHRPGDGDARHVSVVGKGVCYDTGGINVKPANFMNGMHEDMQGSSVALATFLALTRLAPELELDCWLAATENRINSNAYTPNEVVHAMDGTSIEVIHSDAEGRMALADTLLLASRRKPDMMIDFATLTGACISALTTRYSGAFSNRPGLHDKVIDAGAASGERVWPFPLDSDFDAAIESKVADIKQCAIAGGGDHIHAARFLKRFVDKKIDWVHIDLSAGNHKGGLAHIDTETTGFGVRFATQLVLGGGAGTAE